MGTFQDVLNKAKKDGQIDPRLIPWERDQLHSKKRYSIARNVQLPPQLLMLDDDVIHDFLKTIENILIEAESRSLHTIGITSAVAGQGTSTFTAILSLIMAVMGRTNNSPLNIPKREAGERQSRPQPGVLLIDAQLRHPTLHKKFNVLRRGGLIEVLEDKIPFRQSIKKIADSNVRFISIGSNNNFQLTPRLTEKLKSYLKILQTKIEFTILDIPPLLQYSEGIALSKLCDGIILVSKAGETRWEVVQQAKRLLDRANVNIIGGVLNRRKYSIPDWVYKNL